MPRVQFSRPMSSINTTRNMPTPKNIMSINAWYRVAMKKIPEIPSVGPKGSWFISHEIVNEKTILLEIMNKNTSERAAVVFDRQYNNITG